MQNYSELLMSNFIPFCVLVFLLFFVFFNPLYSKEKRNLFIVAVIINIVMIIIISLDYYFSAFDKNYFWLYRRITSFLNFAASPLIPLLLLKIFEQKKYSFTFYLPFILNGIVCFLSIFANIVFYIGEANTYERGPLFFVPFVTTIIYIVFLIKRPISYHAHSKKNERIFLLFVIVLLIICMYFEIGLGMKFFLWNACAIGFTLYYVFLTIHLFIVDSLTGVYNRYMYTMALEKIDKTSSCIIVLLDINNFKEINDIQGHEYGDVCLKKFAHVLSNIIFKVATLYRIGGDEFVIISKKNDIASINALIETAKVELAKNNLSFAYGAIGYTPQGDLHKALEEADKLMYENKNIMKSAK